MLTYRPPRKAAEYFRQQDPNTPINETFIRRLIREGEIPTIRNGAKQLIAVETLEKYLDARARGD